MFTFDQKPGTAAAAHRGPPKPGSAGYPSHGTPSLSEAETPEGLPFHFANVALTPPPGPPPWTLQARSALVIGSAKSPLEEEADRMADSAMRGADVPSPGRFAGGM